MTTNPIKRVSVLSTGSVEIHPQHVRSEGTPQMWWLLTSRRWTNPLPINVYVIEHESGLVLFDTGQDRAAVTDPDYNPGGFTGFIYRRIGRFNIEPQDTLSAQLGMLGYNIADVRTAIFSHLHPDHAGGVPQLRHANLVVSQDEWDALTGPKADMIGLMRNHVDLTGLQWDRIAFQPATDPSLAPFTQAHDLLGDGTLTLLPTPGHTPGSMSLLVRQPGAAPLLMVGDVTYDVHLLDEGHLPGMGNRHHMKDATDKIHRLRKTHPDLVILPAHDPEAANRLAAASSARI
jgi:glyoxylase-like metal-dependent hydrolase (beta-lactamase superfamily II)